MWREINPFISVVFFPLLRSGLKLDDNKLTKTDMIFVSGLELLIGLFRIFLTLCRCLMVMRTQKRVCQIPHSLLFVRLASPSSQPAAEAASIQQPSFTK